MFAFESRLFVGFEPKLFPIIFLAQQFLTFNGPVGLETPCRFGPG
jgi:hypothetical protein